MGSLVLCACLLLARPAGELFADVEERVGRELVEKDVGDWARSLAARPMPSDPEGRFERLIVASLAGHEKEAKRVLDHLARLVPEEQRELECVGRFFLGRDDYDLGRYAHHCLPHMRCGTTYVLVRVLAAREDPDQLEHWLARQAAINRKWIYDQAWFAKRRGKLDRILDELEESIDDLQSLKFFLGVAGHVSARRQLDRLPGRFRPKSRYENYAVGCTLSGSHPCVALVYLERSLRMPFTEQDTRLFEEAMRNTHRRMGSPSDPKELLPGWTKRRLLELYEKTGQPKRAQELLEELAEKYPNGIPADFVMLAGKVQRTSGMRVIANRIEEAPAKDTAGYWLQRAAYYDGREEVDEVAKSYVEAIERADEERKTDIVFQFAHWAWRRQRLADAAPAVRERLRAVDISSPVALRLARALPDGSDAIWRHLGAVGPWGHAQEKGLEVLVESSKGTGRDAVWTRAEALAKGGDLSRTLVVAWLLLKHDEPARAAPHYARAIPRMPDGEERDRARRHLYRSYKEAGDWKRALAAWPEARGRLTPRDRAQLQGELAVCCVRAGHPERAMRVWSRAANFDRLDLEYLERMVDAGVRSELIAFYRDLATKDPRSVAPERALAKLAGIGAR